jgi:hypothetical protein
MELVTDKGGARVPGHAVFETVIDGKALSFTDPVMLGRQLLAAAGCEPVDAFVLIELVNRSTRSVGLDEAVDLRAPGREASSLSIATASSASPSMTGATSGAPLSSPSRTSAGSDRWRMIT